MKKFISCLICIPILIFGNVTAETFYVKPDLNQFKFGPVFDLYLPPLPISQPDLVVLEFVTTGEVIMRADGFQEVPVRVVIKNQGDGISSKFMISARYIESQGDFMRPFTVQGQSSLWKPQTMASMHPGETVAVEGVLVGSPGASGETVNFYIKADSCDGDEFMPEYCRVNESDETNNDSQPITVRLP